MCMTHRNVIGGVLRQIKYLMNIQNEQKNNFEEKSSRVIDFMFLSSYMEHLETKHHANQNSTTRRY